tara:strand:- start:1118 stop:1819 length:702 start_codon:yes stop_codon:yes gene_type:complete
VKISQTGVLHLVSTPIGNMEDITYRAVDTLKKVSLVAAEDTRTSKKLFKHYMISTKLISFYEHNKYSRIPKLIGHLKRGNDLAIISDAGTPGISDPAYRIVRESLKNEIRITSVPGATAVVSALVSSGLPTDRFLFEGFLPPKKGRKKRLEGIKDLDATIVYYESPRRLARTLNDLEIVLGDRPAVVARELTKLYEEYSRGTISELRRYYEKNIPKGEIVILVGKGNKNVYFQ